MAFDYAYQAPGGFAFGATVLANTCVTAETPSMNARPGSDGTIADDVVLVTLLSNVAPGVFASGRPINTNQVRITMCNFSGSTQNLNDMSVRIGTLDPS